MPPKLPKWEPANISVHDKIYFLQFNFILHFFNNLFPSSKTILCKRCLFWNESENDEIKTNKVLQSFGKETDDAIINSVCPVEKCDNFIQWSLDGSQVLGGEKRNKCLNKQIDTHYCRLPLLNIHFLIIHFYFIFFSIFTCILLTILKNMIIIVKSAECGLLKCVRVTT